MIKKLDLFKIAVKETTQHLYVYYFEKNGVKYKFGLTKRKANKKTNISCVDNTVTFNKMLWLRPIWRVSDVVCHIPTFLEADTVCVLIVSGKLCTISGLDEGVFVSEKTFNNELGKLCCINEAKLEALLSKI